MSTLKKVLSLVLCFSLLAGSFAMLGDLAPVASAAATPVVKTVKSYADLCKDYDHFVYFATEVFEFKTNDEGKATTELTDGYVQPGQWLEYRGYVKSDMWVSTITTGVQYDNRLFDAQTVSKMENGDTYEVNIAGTADSGHMNADHPMIQDRGTIVAYTVKPCNIVNQWIKGYTALDADTYNNYDDLWNTFEHDADMGGLAADVRTDTWINKWYLRIQDEPTVETGKSYSEPTSWKLAPLNKNPAATAGDPKVNSNVATGALISELPNAPMRSTCKNMNLSNAAGVGPRYGVVTLLLDDANFTFVVGEPPAAAPKFVAKFMNGDVIVSEAEYEAGAAIEAPAAPVAPAGKSFAGWAVDGEIVTEFVMGEADVTYAAVFEDLPTYKATFVVDGEEWLTSETYVGGAISKPQDPEATEGRSFLYWSLSEDGAAVTDWAMPEGGVTFYAVFSEAVAHKVTYIVNGVAVNSENVIEDHEYTIAGAPEYDAEAYRFLGWSTVEDDAAAIVEGTKTMGTEDVTYYAVFEEIVYYTVSYFVDGAAYGEAVKYEENETYEVSTDEPAKTGYTFVGWSTVENEADAIISGEQTITADVALYAIYKVNSYNATFDANGGAFANGDAKATYLVEYNDYIIAPTEVPVKEGFKFDGWTGYTEGATIGAKDVTYKAKWTAETYTATFYLDADAYAAGTVLKEVAATYDKAVTTGYAAANLAELKPGYKFAGWADAATGEIAANSAVSHANLTKYAYASDKAFYALWTKYDSSITLMVRDYENAEGWVVYDTTFADNGTTFDVNKLKGTDVSAKMGWTDITVKVSNGTFALYDSEDCTTGVNAATYDGDATYYLNTFAEATLTWKSGEETVAVAKKTTNTNPFTYTVTSADIAALDTTPATGYKFVGWTDEAGNVLNLIAGTGYLIDAKNGDQTIEAKFEKIAYTISFNVNNAAGSYAVVKNADKTFSIGDTFSLEGVKYLAADGSETVLPTIGAENGEQTGGNQEDGKSYNNAYGKKFTGWTIGLGENEKAFDLNGSEAITEEFIKKFATGETIKITGQWEALEQKLVFYIVDGVNEDGSDKYVVLKSYDVVTGAPIASYKDEASELAKENTPEGRTFSTWSDTSTVNMPAGGLELYARYQSKAIAVYVDYNNATAENGLTLNETMMVGTFYKAYYGLDIKGVYPDGSAPLYDQIRTMTITNVPGENYICVGWDVYTVEDGKDVYDKANWVKVEGIKDAESYKATSTLIFSANWKAYTDFFFRIYDTNHKIIRAFGKDFKMYYWASEIATDRANADPINHLPDGLVIVLFIPKIEFEGGLTLAIEPFAVNKTFFDPRNFGALLGALGGLLGNLGNL